jgi:hypothetical protein
MPGAVTALAGLPPRVALAVHVAVLTVVRGFTAGADAIFVLETAAGVVVAAVAHAALGVVEHAHVFELTGEGFLLADPVDADEGLKAGLVAKAFAAEATRLASGFFISGRGARVAIAVASGGAAARLRRSIAGGFG